jgi:hypothetical protein
MKDATREATKKTLSTAYKAFVKYSSATNWRALEAAMLDYQVSHPISLSVVVTQQSSHKLTA